MEYKYIKLNSTPHRLDITIDHPPVNILSGAVLTELSQVLEAAEQDQSLRAVVLWGAGKAWSAGADVSEHLPGQFEQMLDVFGGLCEQLRTFPRPTIAAVDGMCLGGGCEVACMCDFVLASERAKFGQPEINVGVLPPVACSWFPAKFGLSSALEIVLTGDVFNAEDSLRLGLVSKILPVAGFAEAIDDFVNRLLRQSGLILEITKAATLKGFETFARAATDEVDQIYRYRLMNTTDAVEGLTAFLEKRKPDWKDD